MGADIGSIDIAEARTDVIVRDFRIYCIDEENARAIVARVADLTLLKDGYEPRQASRAHPFAAARADIIDRNLKAGRANKPVYIDHRGTWTYGQLADRVDRFGKALHDREAEPCAAEAARRRIVGLSKSFKDQLALLGREGGAVAALQTFLQKLRKKF